MKRKDCGFNFDKDTPIFQILQVWHSMYSDEVTRRHNRKQEKLITIQNRKDSLHILFRWFVRAETPQEKVKESLVKISYMCISKYPTKKEKKGWAIMVAKDVAETYCDYYEDDLDYNLLMVSILNGNAKSTFKGEWEQESEPEQQQQSEPIEDGKAPRFEIVLPKQNENEFVPSGVKTHLTVIQDKIMTVEETLKSLVGDSA